LHSSSQEMRYQNTSTDTRNVVLSTSTAERKFHSSPSWQTELRAKSCFTLPGEACVRSPFPMDMPMPSSGAAPAHSTSLNSIEPQPEDLRNVVCLFLSPMEVGLIINLQDVCVPILKVGEMICWSRVRSFFASTIHEKTVGGEAKSSTRISSLRLLRELTSMPFDCLRRCNVSSSSSQVYEYDIAPVVAMSFSSSLVAVEAELMPSSLRDAVSAMLLCNWS